MTTATTATATARRPAFADETAIRGHYQRMLDSWEHGADAYAECFTPDATYIIANGKVQRGWQEIVDGHQTTADRCRKAVRVSTMLGYRLRSDGPHARTTT
jgi:uncharacterized protein (TIGR02246 family)